MAEHRLISVKNLVSSMVTRNKFHTEDPQILSGTVQNVFDLESGICAPLGYRIAWTVGWLVNGEFKVIWKEAVMTYSRYYLRICTWQLRKIPKPLVRDIRCPAEIRNWYLLNTSQKRYWYENVLVWIPVPGVSFNGLIINHMCYESLKQWVIADCLTTLALRMKHRVVQRSFDTVFQLLNMEYQVTFPPLCL